MSEKIADAEVDKFVAEYATNGGNGTRAYLAVRPDTTEKSAGELASRLLKNIKVQQKVEAALRKQITATGIKGEQVLRELWRILNVDIKEAFNENGSLKSVHEIPEDIRRGISGIEVDEIWEMEGEGRNRHKVQIGVTKKVKFWSKTEAANLLGKNLKLWAERFGFGTLPENAEYTLTIKT